MSVTRLLKCSIFTSAVLVSLSVVVAADKPAVPEVVYVPTPYDVVEAMLDLAEVQRDDLVYDLGCGDGRIVVSAAKRHGSRGVGFELVPELVKMSQENARAAGVQDLVSFEQKDVFTLDLSRANVITLYLGWELNKRLLPQFAKLPPGSRIVSHRFGMRGIKPDRVVEFTSREDGSQRTIFLWRTPLKLEAEEASTQNEQASGTATDD